MCARTWLKANTNLNSFLLLAIAVLLGLTLGKLSTGLQQLGTAYVTKIDSQTETLVDTFTQVSEQQVASTRTIADALQSRTDTAREFAAALEEMTDADANMASAAQPTRVGNAGQAKALSGLLAKGATVHKSFAVGDQLTGWDITFGDNRDIYYTTADGQYLLLGAVLDSNGNNISAQHQAKISGNDVASTPAQPASQPGQARIPQETLKRIYDEFQNSQTVTWGRGGPDLYAIWEPHCPYCARLDKQLTDFDGDVTVHYIPVAFLSPKSPTVAAIILDSDDPRSMLDSLERVSWYEAPMGDWIAQNRPDHELPDVRDLLQRHAELMHTAGISGTPALFYKVSDGTVHVKRGLPRPGELDHIISQATPDA